MKTKLRHLAQILIEFTFFVLCIVYIVEGFGVASVMKDHPVIGIKLLDALLTSFTVLGAGICLPIAVLMFGFHWSMSLETPEDRARELEFARKYDVTMDRNGNMYEYGEKIGNIHDGDGGIGMIG